MLVIFQVAMLLGAAKLLGWLAERVHVPGVVGELVAGTVVGPFLLGSLIRLPVHGHWIPLFPAPAARGQWPLNEIVWALAQFASVVLLFVAGLHTDLKQFLRYVGPATLIATVGLVAPFALGVVVVYVPGFRELARVGSEQSVLVPALFVGAILAATSIGITARVLADIERLDTPEGVTILGAAVLDDVLGIVALAVVGGIAASGTVSASSVGVVAAKAFGFWIGLTLAVLALARPIERLLCRIRYSGAMLGLALALAFACSAAAEGFGLAFIIGAYSVGLGLSRTEMAHRLMDELRPVSDFIVPIFFASLGALVDVRSIFGDWRVVGFALAVTAVAIIGKLVACGSAAYATGFNARGAYRIGLGMMPRGEVALIVAGIGLSRGIVGTNVFGASILMTLLTTLLAPVLMVRAFAAGGGGRKRADLPDDKLPSISSTPGITVRVPTDLADLLLNRIRSLAEHRGWTPTYEQADAERYLFRSADDAAQVCLIDGVIRIDASDTRQGEFEPIVAEARESLLKDAGTIGITRAPETSDSSERRT
jgi:Kef-type K+ transport system membrane component KefB